MTSKERFILLSIFISVLGFSLFSAFNPLEQHIGKSSLVVASEYITKAPVEEEYIDYDFEEERAYKFDSNESKVISMLSKVLGLSSEDIQDSLDGGVKPSEMLASEGILLSDLTDEFNFDVVGERGLIRFRG